MIKAFHEVREYDDGFKFWGNQYENIGFVSHWHPEIELIYVNSGVLELNIDNKKLVAKEGDLVFINSGQIHFSIPNNGNNTLSFILFDQSVLNKKIFSNKYKINLISRELLEKHHLLLSVQRLFKIVLEELKQKDIYSADIIVNYSGYFCHLLKREILNNCIVHSSNNEYNRIEDVQSVLRYIEDNFEKQISLEEVSRLLHLSISQFSVVFNKFTGYTFKKYLNHYRIEKACQLLLDKKIPIIEIAYRSGFRHLRTFNRVFKEVTKTTPIKFRKNNQSDSLHLKQHYVTSQDMIISTKESQTKIEY